MDGSVHADLTGNDKVKLKCEFEYQERFPSGVPQFREVEYKIAKSDSKFLKRMGEIRSLEEEKVEKSLAELEQESAYVRELEELLIKKDKALLKGDQAEVKAILEKARAIIAKYKAEEANNERPHNKEG